MHGRWRLFKLERASHHRRRFRFLKGQGLSTIRNAMSQPHHRKEESGQFCWGIRKGTINLYESFSLHGIKYSLYDCVYLNHKEQQAPHIGKLVNIWENEKREKMVKVFWFFRPKEIANWLGDIKRLPKEIFLACGQGKGLSSDNLLETICGKCNVVCSSKHEGNPQPTEEDLRMADHIFYRTFDVGKCIISEVFPSLIDEIEVKHFFNRRKDLERSIVAEPKPNSKSRSNEIAVRAMRNDRVEKELKLRVVPPKMNGSTKDRLLSADPSDVRSLKRRKLLDSLAEGPRDDTLPSKDEKHLRMGDSGIVKKDPSNRVSLDDKARKFAEKGAENKQHISQGIGYKFKEITRRPGMESSKWFKPEIWTEGRLCEANEIGTLVLLENLDPSFTSTEVEDIIWHVFGKRVNAKMIPHTALSSPYSGRALVIFKTKEGADNVISKLTRGCLVLGDGRPIVGQRRRLPVKSGPSGGFLGHLSIDRSRAHRQNQERRKAVATSHFSQANTIEYEMALLWCLHETRTDLCWKNLHEDQGKEIEALMKKMKIHHRIAANM